MADGATIALGLGGLATSAALVFYAWRYEKRKLAPQLQQSAPPPPALVPPIAFASISAPTPPARPSAINAPPAPMPPVPAPALAPAPPPELEMQVADLILKAAQQQWIHESSVKIPFDDKQRVVATVQRAMRLFHEAKLAAPIELKERVRTALASTKGKVHA